MKAISQKRFEEARAIFLAKDMGFDEATITIYSNVFEIISIFTHGKLTTEEIFTAYDVLTDAVTDRRLDLAFAVANEDRIRVMVRLMEMLPETKGKLTVDEKIAMAFCIKAGELTMIYDEDLGIVQSGIVTFDSFEHIQKELEWEKAEFPSYFVL